MPLVDLPLERITWLDAETFDAWQSHEEMVHSLTQGPISATVVGWVVAETEDRVSLISMATEQTYAQGSNIPKSAITERIRLIPFVSPLRKEATK